MSGSATASGCAGIEVNTFPRSPMRQSIRCIAIIFIISVTFAKVSGEAKKPEPPKGGWLNDFPPDLVQVETTKRNPLFYVGEPVGFQLKGPPADRFEVRDFWGDIVD